MPANEFGESNQSQEPPSRPLLLVLPPLDILKELVSSTRIGPQNLLLMESVIEESNTWDELFKGLAKQILAEELLARYPNIKSETENDNRNLVTPEENSNA